MFSKFEESVTRSVTDLLACVFIKSVYSTEILIMRAITYSALTVDQGFPGSSDSKKSAYNTEDSDSIPGSGRSPGEGNAYPLQYSFLENPMDRGAWWVTVHGVYIK